MAEVTGSCTTEYEIDVKRMYLPGIFIKDNCPKCQKPCEIDLSSNCLYYPELNVPNDVGFSCETCRTDWEVAIMLSINVEIHKE